MAEICGIDEAGRGALAGELVVAGCVFKTEFEEQILSLGLGDSKKISEQRREKIFDELVKFTYYKVVYFRNTIIDEIGLSACLRRALELMKFSFGAYEFIYDGNCDYGVKNINTIIKADAKIKQVSAASIIAKVSRDRQMRSFDQIYPEFGYAKHKGYGVKVHLQALNEFGSNELTRSSFHVKSMEKSLFGELNENA